MSSLPHFLVNVYQIDTPGNTGPGSPLSHAVRPFIIQVGIGGLLGWSVGYFSRRAFRLLAIFVAVAFLALQYLAFRGYISGIHWRRIATSFQHSFGSGFFDAVWHYLTYNLPFGGAFAAGFFAGLKKG